MSPDVPRQFAVPVAPPRVVCIATQKGGVGKTSSVVNLGCRLAIDGFNVLIVDLEPQAQAGAATGVTLTQELLHMSLGVALSDAISGLYRNKLSSMVFDRSELVSEYEGAGRLAVLASEEATMTMAQNAFITVPYAKSTLLREMLLDQFAGEFDYILIDTPPAVSSLNAVGLAAADEVISLVNPMYPTVKGAMILKSAVDAIPTLTQGKSNPRFLGAFMNMSNPESSWTVEDVTILQGMIDSGLYPFVTDIRRDRRISSAYLDGRPAVITHLNQPCGKQYTSLAQEVLLRIETPVTEWQIASLPQEEALTDV